jgi:hypothetical protein
MIQNIYFGKLYSGVKIQCTGKTVPLHATKTYQEVGIQLPSFWTSATDGGKWSASHPGLWDKYKHSLNL